MPAIKPDIEPISSCCCAPMLVSNGDEGTNCYICAHCHLTCDPFHFNNTFMNEWINSNKNHKLKPPKSWYGRLVEWVRKP